MSASPPTAAAPAGALPRLGFSIEGVEVLEHAALPTLRFDLHVDAHGASIRSLSLDVIVRIDAARRPYAPAERDRLFELFGAPRDFGRNVHALRWAQASLVLPPFDDRTTAGLCVPCSYDFDVAAHKYLHAVRDGTIPLEFQFRGGVYYRDAGGALRVVRLSWDADCSFAMPAAAWRAAMERYFPNTAWLRVRRDAFDRLLDYRSACGLTSWEATIDALLSGAPDRRGTP